MAKKGVLVVGGAGYIGGAVTDLMTQKKIPYSVYDNLTYESRYLKPGHFIYGDVRDRKKLASVLPNYDAVIWLAAIVGDGACMLHPLGTVEINERAVDWLSKNYRGRIAFTSTCSVYGSNKSMADENAALKPLSLYATSKINGERSLLKNPNSIILRLGTAFGISDTYSRPRFDLLVNTLTAHALKRGRIHVFGGNQKRPLIHARNIAQTLIHNLTTDKTGIYNVATGNFDIKSIAEMIREETGCKVIYTGKRFEDNRHYHIAVTKAEKDKVLSVDKKRDVKFGINEVADLIKSGKVKNIEDGSYNNMRHIATNFI